MRGLGPAPSSQAKSASNGGSIPCQSSSISASTPLWPPSPGSAARAVFARRAETPTLSPPVISFSRAQRPVASSPSSQAASRRGTSLRPAVRKRSTTSVNGGAASAPGRAGQIKAAVSARSPT